MMMAIGEEYKKYEIQQATCEKASKYLYFMCYGTVVV